MLKTNEKAVMVAPITASTHQSGSWFSDSYVPDNHTSADPKSPIGDLSARLSSEESQTNADFLRAFWRYQAYLLYLKAVHMGDIPEADGSYQGDGIARTLDGTPFEPLDWSYLRREGR